MTSAIDRHLASVRQRITSVGPVEAAEIEARGGLLVDIRPAAQRRRFGELVGSIVIERNVLEWRLDPTGDHAVDGVTSAHVPIVIACQEGYASALAVDSLGQIGLTGVCDLAGGFVAWRDAGLPVVAPWPREITLGSGSGDPLEPEVVRV